MSSRPAAESADGQSLSRAPPYFLFSAPMEAIGCQGKWLFFMARVVGGRVMRPASVVRTSGPTLVRSARLGAFVCAGVLAFALLGVPSASAASKPTVSTGTVKGIGTVLVNSKKHTLYTLTNNHQNVACTGACLDAGFTPLTIKAGTKPVAGKGVKGLGVTSDGTQVTVNSFPLFLFTGDTKPHVAN